MAGKAWKSVTGGQGADVSAVRRRIAALALPHVQAAVQTIVDALKANRDTVRLQAATTLLELADTGGEGMDDGATADGEEPKAKIYVIDRRQMSDEIANRLNKESK
jgi:HEAT repeat protein